MPKNAELVQKMQKVIRRSDHKGYMLYCWGEQPGTIDGVYRSPLSKGRTKKE